MAGNTNFMSSPSQCKIKPLFGNWYAFTLYNCWFAWFVTIFLTTKIHFYLSSYLNEGETTECTFKTESSNFVYMFRYHRSKMSNFKKGWTTNLAHFCHININHVNHNYDIKSYIRHKKSLWDKMSKLWDKWVKSLTFCQCWWLYMS